ncbi:MAG TPA: hypothetical protein VKW78_16060 [Terriglobales bacterium]|nr:hypothetical protein [Terriglobales bacterium]
MNIQAHVPIQISILWLAVPLNGLLVQPDHRPLQRWHRDAVGPAAFLLIAAVLMQRVYDPGARQIEESVERLSKLEAVPAK